MTREQIKNLGYTISKIMKQHRILGDMGIAMKYSLAWAPALISDYGREVRLWSSADSDSYEEETYYKQLFFSDVPTTGFFLVPPRSVI